LDPPITAQFTTIQARRRCPGNVREGHAV